MIIPVLGLQAPLTFWCEQIVISLVRRGIREVGRFHGDAAVDVLRGAISASNASILTTSRPDSIVRRAIVESGRPFVLAATSPARSVDVLIGRGIAPLDAARGVLGDVAALVATSKASNALVVSEEDAAKRAVVTVEKIASHLGLDCPKDAAAEIAAGFAEEAGDHRVGLRWAARADRDAVETAFEGLERVLLDGQCDRIVASRRFFTAETTGLPAEGPVEAFGRRGLLIYGPFFALPAGDWTARCVYSFSPQLVGRPMTVDVIHFAGGFHEAARTSFTITSAGRLDVNVRFVHSEPGAQLEVRLLSDKAVFDGTVSLGLVEFRRNPDESKPESEADLFGEAEGDAPSV